MSSVMQMTPSPLLLVFAPSPSLIPELEAAEESLHFLHLLFLKQYGGNGCECCWHLHMEEECQGLLSMFLD